MQRHEGRDRGALRKAEVGAAAAGILDVARYRYPAVWVSVADLWRAARTLDRSSGRSRGLVSLMGIPAATAPPPAENPPPPGPS